MHITPEIRELIVKAKRNGKKVKDIAEMPDVSRKTVWKWVKRSHHPGTEVPEHFSSFFDCYIWELARRTAFKHPNVATKTWATFISRQPITFRRHNVRGHM